MCVCVCVSDGQSRSDKTDVYTHGKDQLSPVKHREVLMSLVQTTKVMNEQCERSGLDTIFSKALWVFFEMDSLCVYLLRSKNIINANFRSVCQLLYHSGVDLRIMLFVPAVLRQIDV